MSESTTPQPEPSTTPPAEPAPVSTSDATPAVAAATASASPRSALPIVAISLAGLAFILAFAAAGIAWLPALAAIILAIVALVKKMQPRILSVIAIIVAPLAWLIAIIVAIVSIAVGIGGAVTTPDTDGGVPVELPAEEQPQAPAADGSSLDAPLPFGSTVEVSSLGGDFEVSFGAINWDATKEVTGENMFNAEPDEGMKYIMLPVTITNIDDEEWNPYGTFFWGDIKLVSGGRGFSEGAIVVVPDGLSDQGDLYPEGTTTGNVVFLVPAEVTEGVWDVNGTFVAAQ